MLIQKVFSRWVLPPLDDSGRQVAGIREEAKDIRYAQYLQLHKPLCGAMLLTTYFYEIDAFGN